MILLDTHVVLWLGLDQARVSKNAHRAIHEARQDNRGLAISDITLMEIAQLSHRGRIAFPTGLPLFLADVERHFVVWPITSNIAMQAFELPTNYPKDPVDRIIGATSLIEDLPLVTADREIRKSRAIAIIW